MNILGNSGQESVLSYDSNGCLSGRLNNLPILISQPKKSSIFGSWKAAQDVKIVLEDQENKSVLLPTFPNTKVNEAIMAVNERRIIYLLSSFSFFFLFCYSLR